MWTHLKQSGRRFSSGSTNSPTPMLKSLFLRLQESMPGAFPPGQLRTLQRRVKQWRSEIARQLVLGLESRRIWNRNMSAGAANSEEVRSMINWLDFKSIKRSGETGICAPALPCQTSAEWKRSISGMLPDSPRRRA